MVCGVLLMATPVAVPAGEAPTLQGPFADNFTLLDPPVPAPPESFQDLDGAPVRLADFGGRVVLLNFWATWCAPCIREMPSLDRLQAALGDEGLSVVAVSIDRAGGKVVAPFAEKLGLEHLGLYLDPKSKFSRTFGLSGLPATFLIDAEGRLVGGMNGPAEWDSPDAMALIRYYLKPLAKRPALEEASRQANRL